MNLTITIPDAIATAAIDAFCKQNGYRTTVENQANGQLISNPETKAAFARRITAEWVKGQCVSGQLLAAAEVASADKTLSGAAIV